MRSTVGAGSMTRGGTLPSRNRNSPRLRFLGHDYDYCRPLMLPGDLLPRLTVNVAVDHGFGDRAPLQFFEQLGLRTDYLSLDAGYRLYSTFHMVESWRSLRELTDSVVGVVGCVFSSKHPSTPKLRPSSRGLWGFERAPYRLVAGDGTQAILVSCKSCWHGCPERTRQRAT